MRIAPTREKRLISMCYVLFFRDAFVRALPPKPAASQISPDLARRST
jgi:hypothetical protein